MIEPTEKPKIEWPNEILDFLQRAGPFWSTVLGVSLVALGWILHMPPAQGSGLGILAIGFLIFVSRHPSRLRRKNALFINRDFFVGREQECEQLTEALRRAQLLWLSGESGSGKSTLLRMGFVPRLKEQREFLPLYIDTWGNDWEAGPVATLGSALRDAISAIGGRLELIGRPTTLELAEYLRQVAFLSARTPVLIFDQFDDYLVDNANRFHPPEGGLIVTAEELKRHNSFWRCIAELLEQGTIRCVFVVRQEQGWGQAAIAFVGVREFFVPRLHRRFLDQILQQLTEGAVENPERGWDRLREQLEKDLYASGGILPIQMRVVLRQLSRLRNLTVRAYERIGGAQGLAADYLAETVDRVCAATGASAAVIQRILATLINPSDPAKTRDVSVNLIQVDAPGIPDEASLTRILNQLKTEEVVRDRADEGGIARWRLDHDYLAVVVPELAWRTNRMQRLLEERTERLRSPGVWKKRDALMNPFDLMRVFWSRARGRLRVGDGWGVVAASSAAWFVALVLAVFVIFFGLGGEFDVVAERYSIALDRSGDVDADEAQKWGQLAQEPLPVRQRVERILLTNAKRANRLMQVNFISPPSGLFSVTMRYSGHSRARVAAAAFGGLSPLAPEQFRVMIGCETQNPTRPACVFLASQFGLDAITVARGLSPRDIPREIISPYGTIFGPRPEFLAEHDIAKFLDAPALVSCTVCSYAEPDEQTVTLSQHNEPARAVIDEALEVLRNPATGRTQVYMANAAVNSLLTVVRVMPSTELISTGKELLGRGRGLGTCLYRAEFVQADDIPTALAALESPVCADYGEAIQKAIVNATTGGSQGSTDRWTFARTWLSANARKYGYEPERHNTFYYSYIRPFLRTFNDSD